MQSLPAANAAAWALKPRSRPLVVSSAPSPAPAHGEVVIKVHCVAVNPIDWIMQDRDVFGIEYPAIFGLDIAGEIVETGAGTTCFRKGQRVIANGDAYTSQKHSHGAFQKFATVPSVAVAALPDNISFERGVVLPLAISTAAAGLYQRGYLALPRPSTSATQDNPKRVLLVWGGSSSVGSTVIQLATASGVDVITTASSRNVDYCRDLGASAVFDYRDAGIERTLVHALKGRTLAGVYHAAGDETAILSCARVADQSRGKAIVVTVRPGNYDHFPGSVRIQGLSANDIFKPGNDVGADIWQRYLPRALADREIVPAPEPLIVGHGLRMVQAALDKQKKGVSAAKVVVAGIDHDASEEEGK